MGNHFYGEYQGDHYEVETKNLSTSQKLFLLLYPIELAAAVVCMFTGHIGYFVVCLGSIFLVVALMLPVIFNVPIKSSLPAKIFLGVAFTAVLIGIIIENHLLTMEMLFGLFLLFWLVLGIVMIRLAFKKPAYAKNCTLPVEATCVTVDIMRRDIMVSCNRFSRERIQTNAETLFKPAFSYEVNGEPYWVESTVYYGDLNKGYQEGEKVTIMVNPENPMEMIPKKKCDGMFLGFGISCIFVTIVGIAASVLIYSFIYG